MKDKTAHPIELDPDQAAFLADMAARFALPDAGKAIRCLVNYARENPERHEDIFAEPRCLDC